MHHLQAAAKKGAAERKRLRQGADQKDDVQVGVCGKTETLCCCCLGFNI
jgi:hypothetical protein